MKKRYQPIEVRIDGESAERLQERIDWYRGVISFHSYLSLLICAYTGASFAFSMSDLIHGRSPGFVERGVFGILMVLVAMRPFVKHWVRRAQSESPVVIAKLRTLQLTIMV